MKHWMHYKTLQNEVPSLGDNNNIHDTILKYFNVNCQKWIIKKSQKSQNTKEQFIKVNNIQ